jgi:hypothetical protein
MRRSKKRRENTVRPDQNAERKKKNADSIQKRIGKSKGVRMDWLICCKPITSFRTEKVKS